MASLAPALVAAPWLTGQTALERAPALGAQGWPRNGGALVPARAAAPLLDPCVRPRLRKSEGRPHRVGAGKIALRERGRGVVKAKGKHTSTKSNGHSLLAKLWRR